MEALGDTGEDLFLSLASSSTASSFMLLFPTDSDKRAVIVNGMSKLGHFRVLVELSIPTTKIANTF